MDYKNLSLLGTSHIAKQSLRDVRKAFEEKEPHIVCLELDTHRLYALVNNVKRGRLNWKTIRKIGIKGFLFALIGAWAEKKLGKAVGVNPGSEMLLAFKLAGKTGAMVALIDRHIEITLRRFSKTLTWKEKWNFIVDIFKAAFAKKKTAVFDLRTVPSQKTINKMIKEVKDRYPNVYKVLIDERNKYMANNLARLMQQNPKKSILAIIGAGHEKEMLELIKNFLKTKEYIK